MRSILFSSLLLVGCVAPEPADAPPEDRTPVVIDQGDCAAVWGDVPAEGRIFVDAINGDHHGTGTIDDPLDSVRDGVIAARLAGIKSVAVAPGEYEDSVWLDSTITGWENDAGLEITGCGVGVTIINATIEYEEDPNGGWLEYVQPIFDIGGIGTDGVVVRDLTGVGGRRAVRVRSGAGATDPVRFERVTLEDSLRLGVLIDGVTTVANLEEVHVDGVVVEDGVGTGIAIQTGAWVTDDIPAPTTLDASSVEGASGVGILAEGGWNTLTDVTVANTASIDGQLGRGIQIQSRTQADLSQVTSTGNADAALFLHMPGRNGIGISISDSVLGDTVGADVMQTGEVAAEGLSVTNGGDPSTTSEMVTMSGTALSGNARADVLVDGASVDFGEGNTFGQDGDYGVVVQGNGVAQGGGGSLPVTELGSADSLGLIHDAIALDGLD